MPVNAELALQNWTRFTWCRDHGHLEFIAKADRCDAFFAGNQWTTADKALLDSQRRPALTINKIIGVVGTILGEQIYNRTEVLFRPTHGAPSEVAEALTKVWTQISQNNQLPWIRSDVFCDGIVRGRGFYDVRIDFTDSLLGEVRITPINSKNVIIDPDAEEYDPDSWNDVFVSKWLTWQDISTLYNEKDGKYLKEKQGSCYAYGYDSIESTRDRFGGYKNFYGTFSNNDNDFEYNARNIRVIERQYRKLDKQLHFVDITTGDMRPVPEDWDRDKIAILLEKAQGQLSVTKKLIKRIRWTVTADDVVLMDEWSPYKHFTVVPYFPHFRYGKTVGIVENLLSPQEILNKASSQELHVINTTANSGWVVEAGSLMNMSIEELEAKGAQTGLVVEYAKGAQPPEKIQPNQVPSGLDRVTYKAEEHIKTIANVSDSMLGFDREDVAAKAIAYKQQRGSVNMSKVLDNLERTDWILARNVLDLVQTYYTEPRILNITHDDLTREVEEMQINMPDPVTGQIVNDLTIGEYDIIITTSPYRASLEDSQFEQARAMREIGIPIPDSVLIENSRLLRRAEILKQMESAQNSEEAQQQAQLQMRDAEAEIAVKEAQAQKVSAEAQKVASEIGQNGDNQQFNAQQMQFELQMQRQQAEMELAKERQAFELEIERRQAALKEQEMALKIRELELKLALEQGQMVDAQREREDKLAEEKKKQAEDAKNERVKMLKERRKAAKPKTSSSTSQPSRTKPAKASPQPSAPAGSSATPPAQPSLLAPFSSEELGGVPPNQQEEATNIPGPPLVNNVPDMQGTDVPRQTTPKENVNE